MTITATSWTGDPEEIWSKVRAGGHVLFLGGRQSGKSHVANAVATRARAGSACVALADLSSTPPADAAELFEKILPPDVSEAVCGSHDIDVAVSLLRAHVAQSEARFVLGVIDGFETVALEPWGVPATVTLRSLLTAGAPIRLALFTLPRAVKLLGGGSSPLLGMFSHRIARPVPMATLRSDPLFARYEVRDVSTAHGLVGGVPGLLIPAVTALAGGMSPQEVVDALSKQYAEQFGAQFDDLSSAARLVIELLEREGPLGPQSIQAKAGVHNVFDALNELEASLMVQQVGGAWRHSSPVQARWLQHTRPRASIRSRRPLASGDTDAYEHVSRLEWQLRTWLREKLISTFGESWWHDRIPEVLRQRAEERMVSERGSSHVVASDDVLDYIDFTDFRQIIQLRAVWREAFAPVLDGWQPMLIDALARLEAVRRKVAHSRALTAEEIERTASDTCTVRDLFSRVM